MWNIDSLAKYLTINYTGFGWNNMANLLILTMSTLVRFIQNYEELISFTFCVEGTIPSKRDLSFNRVTVFVDTGLDFHHTSILAGKVILSLQTGKLHFVSWFDCFQRISEKEMQSICVNHLLYHVNSIFQNSRSFIKSFCQSGTIFRIHMDLSQKEIDPGINVSFNLEEPEFQIVY